ncbi:hypothetical protein C1N83_03890 [Priestia aryabhattai]
MLLLWIIFSFSKGQGGEWWSMYHLNSHKYGPWALGISYIKISVAAVISLVIAYIASFGFKRKKEDQLRCYLIKEDF